MRLVAPGQALEGASAVGSVRSLPCRIFIHSWNSSNKRLRSSCEIPAVGRLGIRLTCHERNEHA